jgi:hypothetical protein
MLPKCHANAKQSLRNRSKIAVRSLRNRYEIATRSLRDRYAIAAQKLRKRCANAATLLRDRNSHSSLLTPHSSLLTPHSSLLTPHSSLLNSSTPQLLISSTPQLLSPPSSLLIPSLLNSSLLIKVFYIVWQLVSCKFTRENFSLISGLIMGTASTFAIVQGLLFNSENISRLYFYFIMVSIGVSFVTLFATYCLLEQNDLKSSQVRLASSCVLRIHSAARIAFYQILLAFCCILLRTATAFCCPSAALVSFFYIPLPASHYTGSACNLLHSTAHCYCILLPLCCACLLRLHSAARIAFYQILLAFCCIPLRTTTTSARSMRSVAFCYDLLPSSTYRCPATHSTAFCCPSAALVSFVFSPLPAAHSTGSACNLLHFTALYACCILLPLCCALCVLLRSAVLVFLFLLTGAPANAL